MYSRRFSNDPLQRVPNRTPAQIVQVLRSHGLRIWIVTLADGLRVNVLASSQHDARNLGEQIGGAMCPATWPVCVTIRE